MNIRSATVIVVALSLLVAGCASPMQSALDQHPGWKKGAQSMVTNAPVANGLDWHPFPDPKNPLHSKIWKALWDKGDEGLGYGRICNYYGFYLVTVPNNGSIQTFPSFFYDPKSHLVFAASEDIAFSFYKGNREATPANVVALMRNVLAVDGYQTFVISNSTDIPHTEFTKDNPNLSFKDWLLSKGIVITPPTFTKKNEHAEVNGFSEYNVFVYMPVGGQLFRYEVRCRDGHIWELTRYVIGSDIGDAWYLM